jgi:hypothetical protein
MFIQPYNGRVFDPAFSIPFDRKAFDPINGQRNEMGAEFKRQRTLTFQCTAKPRFLVLLAIPGPRRIVMRHLGRANGSYRLKQRAALAAEILAAGADLALVTAARAVVQRR